MEAPGILIILDADHQTELSRTLVARIRSGASAEGRLVETVALGRDSVPPCTACFHCLTHHPGRCRFSDTFTEIRRLSAGCPLVLFLSPVVFGTFSATIKNVVDRGGLVIKDHRTCLQVVVGYGGDITEEECRTFIDLTEKHRGAADIVHPTVKGRVEVYVSRSLGDNEAICGRLAGAAW